MVVTLGKEMKINHGMNNCNILVRESFGEGQLKKKSMKNLLHPTIQPKKKSISNCNANTMLDLREEFTSNFNLWSFNENRLKKKKMGRRNQS
jgi:hypothetical protein